MKYVYTRMNTCCNLTADVPNQCRLASVIFTKKGVFFLIHMIMCVLFSEVVASAHIFSCHHKLYFPTHLNSHPTLKDVTQTDI